MKLIYCDETNMQVKNGDFLIYGGLVVDSSIILKLTNRIWKIREEYGIDREEKLKFNPGPRQLDHQQFLSLKSDLLNAAIETGCKLLVYNVLHDLVKDVDLGRRNGINEICLNFSYILKAENTCGMILVDRFNDKGNRIDAHLTEKFSVGLKGLPHSDAYPLDRVVGLHYTAIGQSHIPSLVDIVLGSYRFALNCHCRDKSEHLETSKVILQSLAPLFPMDRDTNFVPRIGVSFSPLEVRVPKFRQKYSDAISFLRRSGINVSQRYN